MINGKLSKKNILKIMFIFSFVATLVGSAVEAMAANVRWQQKRIRVVDTTNSFFSQELIQAAQNWTDGSVIKLVVTTGGPVNFWCPPSNPIPVCAEHYGSTGWFANTQVVYNKKNIIEAASIQVNLDYVRPDNTSHEVLLYILGHELGHAIAVLAHTTRYTSIMSFNINPYPDLQDYINVNRQYGR